MFSWQRLRACWRRRTLIPLLLPLFLLVALSVRWSVSELSFHGRIVTSVGSVPWPEVSALLRVLASVLTVWPIYLLARRLGGTLAACTAAWLTVVSPLALVALEVESGTVWATLCVAVCLAALARVLVQETLGAYVVAGLAAGVAAVISPPAAWVMLALPAAWLQQRWPDGSTLKPPMAWGYLGAASLSVLASSLLALVTLPNFVPSLFAPTRWPGASAEGGAPGIDLAEPARLTAEGYLGVLLDGVGVPALLLAGLGISLLWPASRRVRLIWLLPFPLALLVFLLATRTAAPHELSLLLPPLAVLLGVGLSGLVRWMQQRCPLFAAGKGRVRGWPCKVMPWFALTVALLPSTVTTALDLRRPEDRDAEAQMTEWIRGRLPRGAALLTERGTLRLDKTEYIEVRPPDIAYIGELPLDAIRLPEVDFVLLDDAVIERFSRPALAGAEDRSELRQRYQVIRDTWPVAARFAPSGDPSAPGLTLYRVPWSGPAPTVPEAGLWLPARTAVVPDESMRQADETVRFSRSGQWILFKMLLPRGTWVVSCEGDSTSGRWRAVTAEGRMLAMMEGVSVRNGLMLRLARPEQVFVYLDLPRGATVRGVHIR